MNVVISGRFFIVFRRRHSHHHRGEHYYDFRQITQITQQFITNHWILKSIVEECMDKHGNRMKKFLFPFHPYFFCFHRIQSYTVRAQHYLCFRRKVIMNLKNIACRENWNDGMERVRMDAEFIHTKPNGIFFLQVIFDYLRKLNEGKLSFLKKMK